jgi:predicted permease
MEVSFDVVGPRYFETLRVPLLKGRGFTSADVRGSAGVVVVNQAFVRRYWPGEDGLGKRLGTEGPEGPMLEVVGVAGDGRYVTLGEDPRPFMFMPLLQQYESAATLVARTTGDPAEVLGPLKARIQSSDATLPVFEARTLVDHLGLALLPARVAGGVLGAFGALGLLLAAIGLYGVMAYAVSQRTRELGIRTALGAERGDLVRMVVREGMRLTAWGIGFGLVLALVAGRLSQSLLYGISGTDAITFAGVACVLGGSALLACWLPARRASRVDPLVALRTE